MRGSNGGWNRSHGQIEKTPRIDSFDIGASDGWGSLYCGFKVFHALKENGLITVFLGDGPLDEEVNIGLSHKPNGYGGQQTFFICPACGQRVRFLYQAGETFLCRRCSNLNYKSQQETRSDSMYYFHQGVALVEKHLDTWPRAFLDGFGFCTWLPERPWYMHSNTYRRYLARFMKYQERYNEKQLQDLQRILGILGKG